MVLNSVADAPGSNPSIELSEDLLAITTVFVAKNNGLRSAKYRIARIEKERREGREGGEESKA